VRALRIIAAASVVLGLTAGPAAAAGPYQPDGAIRPAGSAREQGDGVYNADGSEQTIVTRIGPRGVGDFFVTIENDGTQADTFRVSGSNHTSRFTVRYVLEGREVSTAVKAGTLQVGPLEPGEERVLRVRIGARTSVRPGAAHTARVVARSTTGDTVDVTRAKVVRPLYSRDQERVLDQINQTRASHGLGRLAMNRALAEKAQSWARHLVSIGRLAHSDVTDGAPPGWEALGENVGYARDLAEMHRGFLGSSGHRANILGRFNYVGTGVAYGHQRVWVVHVFMRR